MGAKSMMNKSGRKSREWLSEPKLRVINVITSSNKLLATDASSLVNLLWNSTGRTPGVAKVELTQSLVTNCLPSHGKKLVMAKFLSNPPPFVSQKMGWSIDEYINFITDITTVAEKCDKATTDTEHTAMCTKVAGTFEKAKDGLSNMQKNFNVKVRSGGKSTTYKLAITKQMVSFIATLFYCLKNEDAFAEPDPLIDLSRWPDALLAETIAISEIQDSTEVNAKIIISILEKRNLPRDQDRMDALRLLNVQLTNLSESEAKTVSTDTVRCKYKDIGSPMAVQFILDCFKNKLNRGNSNGIATARTLMKSCLDTTEFGEILEYVWKLAEKVPRAIDVSEAIKPKEDIPVKGVAPAYKCLLKEPQPISVKFKFIPPVYNNSRDWLSFVEFKLIPYYVTHTLSYRDRANALWYSFPTVNYRNRYLNTFSDCINGVKTQEDFTTLYRSVGQTFWPEQTKLAHDFEKQLRTPSFIRQYDYENHEDFVLRLQETFERAYPSSHDSDTNKLKLCEIIFTGIRESWLKNILFNEHYDKIFVTGEVNKLLLIMRSEMLKAYKAKALAKEGLSLNYISESSNRQPRRPKERSSTWSSQQSGRPVYSKNSANNRYHQNSKKPEKKPSKLGSEIKEELQFLLRNKNVGPGGRLIVPTDKIPDFIRKAPGFDARNYVSKDGYAQVRKMAEANVKRKHENKKKKTKNTRRYRRVTENKYRRNNTLIEPQRRYINAVNHINNIN